MAIYRARACPKCQYYVGYSVTRPFHGMPESLVKSFCLNCNYQLPVRAVLCGMKNFPPLRRTPAPATAPEKSDELHDRTLWTPPPVPAPGEGLAQRANYARELRVIGQELEKRHFTIFNLKCSEEAYFVWSTEVIAPAQPGDAATIAGQSETHSSDVNPDDQAPKMLLDRIVGFLFNASDVKRLERDGVQHRGQSAISNGRRLSHLLRTVGEEVDRRNQRLLAVAWQEHQVSVVVESARGHREINVLRTDNLYDLWVRMYLQRSH